MNKNTHWKCPQCKSIIRGNNYHEITEHDLQPNTIIKIQARSFPNWSIFGGLRHFDVGKRLYLINGILYIENQEQYEKRIKENK
jgi:phage FluMu protein Com